MAETAKVGNREAQAELWGQRASGWAEVMEGEDGWGVPLYEHVLERVELGSGSELLDVGCGAGRFARLAAERGHKVSGLDATPEFVEIAAGRVPGGDFRVGEMEALPWEEDRFDLVTGFNSFFIADDMVRAMREAGRVARADGFVATSVFGRPDRCDTTAMFEAVRGLFPPSPEGDAADDGPGLHEVGTLEAIAEKAGLRVHEAGYLAIDETYADLETLLRGLTAAPPMIRAARVAGDDAVREVIAGAFAEQREPDGSYVLREESRYLVARPRGDA